MPIDALIFSKNRPAQLDLLLRSIERYAPDVFRSVTILSGTELRDVDLTHQGAFAWRVDYLHGFEHEVRRFMRGPGRVCFLVDDDVFFRKAGHPTVAPFSFRTGEYWYYFTLDGGVYQRSEVRTYLDFPFVNPTQLEAGVANKVVGREIPNYYPCLVGIPANRVSESSGMPHMGVDVEELNARYLAGERIDLDKVIAQIDPAGDPHQEIVYEWLPRSS